MTDGWVREGELIDLARQMSEEGITLSVVAAGGGAAEYLAELSSAGGGRFYPAQDILGVPDIFLKETVTSVGQYIVEEPFYPLPSAPGPVLRGLDPGALPALLGYNGTTPKATARLDLLTPRGDPLLATWQYGLGRAAVWTSDVKGQWAREWVGWEEFGRFAAQLVGWTLPTPQVEGLHAEAGLEDGQAAIRLGALDENGRPRNFLKASGTIVSPDLESQSVELEQVGPGQYEVKTDISQPGTYLVRVGVNAGDQSLGQMTLGLVVPYSPEYRTSGIDQGLLSELARLTGGGPLTSPLEAFLHNLPAADFAREIWRGLLLAAALLFPIDVALRRVLIGRQETEKALAWLRQRLPGRRAAAGEGRRALGQLFQARDRARQRMGGPPAEKSSPQTSPPPVAPAGRAAPAKPETPAPKEPPATPPPPGPAPERPKPVPPAGEEDALARLREAKKRARRQ
jgi:hypothetical protein